MPLAPQKEKEMAKKEETKELKNKETEEVKNGKEKNSEEDIQADKQKKELAKPAKKAAPKKTAAKAEKKSKDSNSAKSSPDKKVKLSAEERKRSKKYRQVEELVEREKQYPASEAIDLAKKTTTTKFDSSVEIHIRLNVNPTAADQQVRGTVVLPNGTGKTQRVAVVCGSDKEKEAKDAGADLVGEQIIADVEKGKIDFDILVATPDMMAKIGKLGKTLGTKGLMPNPKSGTVTPDVAKAVKELKAGRVEFKVDKNGIVHLTIGKVSFDQKKLEENYETLIDALRKAKPSGVKGTYIKSVALATTMGPGIKIEI